MVLSNKFCKLVCDNRIARHHQSMLLGMRRDYHFIIHLWFHHTEYIIYLHIPYYFNIQNHLQIYIAQVIFSLILLEIFKYLNLAHKIPLITFVSSIFLLIQRKKNHNIKQFSIIQILALVHPTILFHLFHQQLFSVTYRSVKDTLIITHLTLLYNKNIPIFKN